MAQTTAGPENGPVAVDFWFDPACPYTWLTSRWMREVERVRPVAVRWHVMSLAVLNEHRDEDPEGDTEGYLWMPVRICAAVAAHGGEQALGRFYTALGRRFHGPGGPDWEAVPDALAEAGLPVELAGAATATEHDGAVRASHGRAMELIGGDHVGTPVIAVDADRGPEATAFFGPVISRVPVGEDAGRLWDGTLLVAGVPGFHELKGRPHEAPRTGTVPDRDLAV
ncbi:disulfide bond formation protein DsbA [Allonocardiopsis opalescens]|uniref:DSBA-like thioredoxin domain-containing protein n=1 Tax=Allonocardiopsis opalescens TaxID=1144618 RepID=A0A2T0QAA0_9ACTN|nr:disulfide bond formation protein DsbA [Allonocardiopsis opalescens]PRY00763.1 hypothetical protein CLV72_102395 [Allonocardiopsis opalescens]